MPNAKDIDKILAQNIKEIERELMVNLPRKVGVIAKNQFTDNFRKGGFLDNGIQPWRRTKRQDGEGTDARYSPLTSRRDHLMRSITVHPSPGKVEIRNDVEYANIHNEGGNTHPRVTPKMRKFAWAKFYSLSNHGKDITPEAESWKGLALTKKRILNIRIPQRKFIGDSRELTEKIEKLIQDTIQKITNGINSL